LLETLPHEHRVQQRAAPCGLGMSERALGRAARRKARFSKIGWTLRRAMR
jgi:hypothetical protein